MIKTKAIGVSKRIPIKEERGSSIKLKKGGGVANSNPPLFFSIKNNLTWSLGRSAATWDRPRLGDVKMTVLEEIFAWSQDRPAWQRDALRRLVQNGDLSDDDVGALTDICKSAHGLAEHQGIALLGRDHVPEKTVSSAPVSLVSIFHHRGVNALAEGQALNSAPNLTVVYGDNAAGETGYIRILKSACRARGQEQILGNVVSGTAALSPVVSIKYKLGTESEPREWDGSGEDEFISRVSVFDTQCAAVYLTEKTDVAFRPFGLDLFDKLVKACKAVQAKLDGEQRALTSNALAPVQAQIPEGTTVAKLLASISSLTKPESVQALALLSPEEETRLALYERFLRPHNFRFLAAKPRSRQPTPLYAYRKSRQPSYSSSTQRLLRSRP